MSEQLFTNNAVTLLDADILIGDLSLTVTAGEGALFPTPTGGDWFNVTLELGSIREIVQVTTRSTDTFTIVRAQDGSSAAGFVAGTTISLRTHAGFLGSLVVGPASSTDDNIAVNDGTTGTLLKDGAQTIAQVIAAGAAAAPAGDVVGPASAVDDNIATYDLTTGKLIQDGGQTIAQVTAAGAAAAPQGDVVGPASAVDERVAVFDGVTGKLVKDGGVLISGSNTGDQTISDATITTTDITTNNATSSKHGFLPKLSGTATEYLDGSGVFSTPAGTGGGGGGGSEASPWVVIETQTPAGVASIDLEAFAGQGFSQIKVYMTEIVPSVDGSQFTCQYKQNAAYKATDYRWRVHGITTGSTVEQDENNNSDTIIGLNLSGATWGFGNATLENGQFELSIGQPDGTAKPKVMTTTSSYGAPSGSHIGIIGVATFDGTDAADALEGLRIAVDSGTFTGSVCVLGLDPTQTGSGTVHQDFPEPIINGSTALWQRGTSWTTIANGTYIADRFKVDYITAGSVDVSKITPVIADMHTAIGQVITDAIRLDVNTIDATIAGADFVMVSHRVEGYRARPFMHNQFVLSFLARSNITGTFGIAIRNSGVDRSFLKTFTIDVADTWERKEIVVPTQDQSGTWDYEDGIGLDISVVLVVGPTLHGTDDAWNSANNLGVVGGTNWMATATNNFDITAMQLDLGAVAQPYRGSNCSEDLAAASRYFQKSYNLTVDPATSTEVGAAVTRSATTAVNQSVQLSARMRATPTVVLYSTTGASANIRDLTGAADRTAAAAQVGDGSFTADASTTITDGNEHAWQWTADAEL